MRRQFWLIAEDWFLKNSTASSKHSHTLLSLFLYQGHPQQCWRVDKTRQGNAARMNHLIIHFKWRMSLFEILHVNIHKEFFLYFFSPRLVTELSSS